MGLSDRDYNRYDAAGRGGRGGGRGGVGRAIRRVFVEGDGFYSWAVPLYKAWGILVKVHVLFILLIVVRLLRSGLTDSLGFPYALMSMASLFVLVLLHEYGHCIACRRVGGEADEILMWPLGGLAFCKPPHHWKAELITVAGGPMVNVVLAPVLGVVLLVMGAGAEHLVFNPFAPGWVFATLPFRSYAALSVWWLYYINLALLLFNVLVPMYPMDGGRIVHTLLWRKLGYDRATYISANIGFFAAIALGVFAIGFLSGPSSGLMLGLALFGGFSCWQEKQRLAMMSALGAGGGEPWSSGGEAWRGGAGGSGGGGEDDRKFREAARRQREQEQAAAEVDRILDKVHKSGLQSLTRKEKAVLRKASGQK